MRWSMDMAIDLLSQEVREAVTAGGTREQVRFEVFEGAGHAFDNPDPLFHHPGASAAAWARTEQFLGEALPSRYSPGCLRVSPGGGVT